MGSTQHYVCLIIGVVTLVSSIVDIVSHFLIVGVITNGFQCDANALHIKDLSNVPYMMPGLLIANLGTHGFYPFPHIIKNQFNTYVEYMEVTTTPKCYPGVFHVYIADVLNFLINLIWLKFVIDYIKSLFYRDYEQMKMFISMSIVKLVMQVIYLGYYPRSFEGFIDVQTFWLLKMLDIVIAAYILILIIRYANVLRAESKAAKTVDKPPSYIESLVGTTEVVVVDKKSTIYNIEENKETDMPKTPLV